MKRSISLILALILVISTGSVFAEIGDYEESWAKEEISYMVSKGVISGYPDGTFKPNNNMTNAEFYTVINTLVGYTEKGEVDFEDVNPEDWFYGQVQKASKANYLPTGKTLNPNEKITRGEVARIIGNVFDIEEDLASADEFADSETISKEIKAIVGGLKKKGYIAGYPDKTFRHESEISRAEVVRMLYSVSGQVVNEASEINEDIKTNLLVSSKDVVLENMTIEENLYLTEAIGEGDVTLDNVVVKGELFIKGGGSNSIKIKNSKINKVSIDKQERSVRVVFENSSVEEIRTNNQSRVELTKGSKVADMKLNGKTDLSLEKGTSIDALSSESKEVNIESKGTIESIKTKEDIKVNKEIVKANTETKVDEGKVSKVKESSKNELSTTPSSSGSRRGSSSSSTPPAKPDTEEVEDVENVEDEKPAEPAEPEIPVSKLDISTDSINTGKDTDLIFRYKYEGKSKADFYLLTNKDGKLTPYMVNGKKVQLKDDGDQENGDLLENDGIYSSKESIKEDEEGYLNFIIGVKEGNTWKVVSSQEEILVINPLSDEEIATVKDTSENLKTQVKNLKSDGKTQEEIKKQVKDDLVKKEDIKEVGESESGNGIWYALESGVLGAFTLGEDDPNNKNSQNSMKQSVFNLQKEKVDLKSTKKVSISVGNPLVGIFTAHGEKNTDLLGKFSEIEENTFSARSFTNEEVTIEKFKKLSNYGTIIFDTKGESLFKGNLKKNLPNLNEIFSKDYEKIVILTGEAANEISIAKYNADLKTGRLVIVDDYFAITTAFIDHYIKGQDKAMPNSLVYANTNQSMHNEKMAEAFIRNGAQTYVGHEKSIASDELVETIGEMLKGTSVENAVENAKVFGNKELVLLIEKMEQKFINPSLEEGLKGWIGRGHIDTISRLGSGNHEFWNTIRPTKDNHMGIISSGVDDGALSGRQSWIYQTFTVPEDMTNLKFDYNVASSEPMVFIGTQFDDKFKATIVEGPVKEPSDDDGYEEENENHDKVSMYSNIEEDPIGQRLEGQISTFNINPNNSWVENTVDANEVIIGFESINSSDWGQDFLDDRNRVDVVFPHGDKTTYMTGWKTVNYDISKYQGKTITLKLQVWDLGDTAYPTAVLFDNVRLESSTTQDVGIKGRDQVMIPKHGSNDYFYLAGKTDQSGDILTGKIEIENDDGNYEIPKRELTANIKLKEEVDGISLDTSTGVLSVDRTAKEGTITLIAYDNGNERELSVELKNEPKLEINHAYIHGPNHISVDTDLVENFSVSVRDYFGEEIDYDGEVTWELEENIKGININEKTGKLSITASELEENIFINIRATLVDQDMISATHGVHIIKAIDEKSVAPVTDIRYEKKGKDVELLFDSPNDTDGIEKYQVAFSKDGGINWENIYNVDTKGSNLVPMSDAARGIESTTTYDKVKVTSCVDVEIGYVETAVEADINFKITVEANPIDFTVKKAGEREYNIILEEESDSLYNVEVTISGESPEYYPLGYSSTPNKDTNGKSIIVYKTSGKYKVIDGSEFIVRKITDLTTGGLTITKKQENPVIVTVAED